MITRNIVKQKGFTLIELMVTVAIVAILSAIGVPSYQNYTIRAQATEGITLASGAKAWVTEYHANHGEWPDPNQITSADFSSYAGKYIEKTEISDNGIILAIFSSNANEHIAGKSVHLVPTIQTPGNIAWDCQSNIDEVYLPSSCSHVNQ